MFPSLAHAFTSSTAIAGASTWYGAEWDVVTATFRPERLHAANAAANALTIVDAGPMTCTRGRIDVREPRQNQAGLVCQYFLDIEYDARVVRHDDCVQATYPRCSAAPQR